MNKIACMRESEKYTVNLVCVYLVARGVLHWAGFVYIIF